MATNRALRLGLRDIVGRRIVGAIAKEHASFPNAQVFLIFEDGGAYEFYSSEICGANGVHPDGLDWARGYMGEQDIVFHNIWDK